MLQMFPLLAVSLVIYAVLTLANMTVGTNAVPWNAAEIVALPLASGDQWVVRGGDVFLVGSMGLLFVELIRATRTDTSSVTNHILSLLLSVAALLMFIFLPGFGNSVFFILIAMMFLDTMAGLVVTTNSARRDVAFAERGGLPGGG